jgi:hypothetical protein
MIVIILMKHLGALVAPVDDVITVAADGGTSGAQRGYCAR